jgi:hypothetical protein
VTDLSLPAPPPAPRLIAVVTPRMMATRLPLGIVFGYVVATFVLFVVWPIDWPIYSAGEWARLIGYVGLCFVAIGGGALVGSAGETRVVAPLPLVTLLLVAGAAVSAALLEPSAYAYTGRTLWEIRAAFDDQGAAYRRLQEQLFATTGQRNTLVVVRALLSPLTYAVLPLGVIRWRAIGWTGRVALIVSVICSIAFSIMRGTDKEIADLFIIGVAAASVSYGRHHALGLRGFDLVRRYWKQALIALVFLYVAQGMFTTRKDERLHGGYASRTAVCANDSHICANLETPWIAWLPERQAFGATFFILSACSGYYGLDLALDKPFESTYGVGHSPAAMNVYETLTGDPSLHLHSFTYRNGDDGWSEEFFWSTLMTWIANDVGFGGAVIVLALIGLMWGKWWREAAAGMSDPAAVLFTIATMAMIYLPANNQVLGSYDGYVTLSAWIAIWLWHRQRYGLSALVGEAAVGA